mgnify:CR=1 FL=1
MVWFDNEGALCPFVVSNTLTMERTNLTKDELVLVINSVQRQIIVLDKTEKQDAELMPKYRLLLKTLLEMEDELSKPIKKEPLNYYK